MTKPNKQIYQKCSATFCCVVVVVVVVEEFELKACLSVKEESFLIVCSLLFMHFDL
jgi:hypothetical protein